MNPFFEADGIAGRAGPAIVRVAGLLGEAEYGPGSRLRAIAELLSHMQEHGSRRDDPIRETCARLGDKWSPLLLLLLDTGSLRFGMLQRLVAAVGTDLGISRRMLTLRLRNLERDGFVRRTVTPTVPPQVSYALTELGGDLVLQLRALITWVAGNAAAIKAARAAYDVDDGARA